MNLTLITGNQGKADQLAKWLDMPVKHVKLDLDELQSLDAKVILEHKVRQAYDQISAPVLVDDVDLSCNVLHGLPGPLIKWFIQEDISLLCRMLNSFDDRSAMVHVRYALYDGKETHFFEGNVPGQIAEAPRGDGGFGWDAIFIPKGSHQTRAEQNEADYEASSPRAKAIVPLKKFLGSRPDLAA
jgi:non-canonical purine NTP pyrophosphatase (RdgB/HAM1 family)